MSGELSSSTAKSLGDNRPLNEYRDCETDDTAEYGYVKEEENPTNNESNPENERDTEQGDPSCNVTETFTPFVGNSITDRPCDRAKNDCSPDGESRNPAQRTRLVLEDARGRDERDDAQ